MKTLYAFLTVLTLAGGVLAADGTLTRDEQLRIIQDYLYVTGRSSSTQSLGEELGYSDTIPIKSGTPAILNFMTNRDKLDKDLLMSLGITDEVERPILDLHYDSPDGLFRIHYTKTGVDSVYQSSVDTDGDGVPNYIESMAVIADSVYHRLIDGLGFPPPIPDTLCAQGEDAKYDIYVLNLSSNIFGLTYADTACAPDKFDLRSVPAFLELDNDYQHVTAYRLRPLDAVRVTVAHEFFHAIQFAMDWTEFENLYWLEMSATWSEEYNYDNINDYYNYLPYFLDEPLQSLQRFSTGGDLHPYGSVIFAIYLTETYGPEIIRAIWEKCRNMGVGGDFLPAADQVIDSISAGEASFGSAFAEFAKWNYFTGSRWDFSQPGNRYSEGQNYPLIPDEAIHHNYQYPVKVLASDLDNGIVPQHCGVSYIKFEDTRTVQEDRFWICNPETFDTSCTGATCDTNKCDQVDITDTLAYPDFGWDSLFTADCPYQSLRQSIFTPGDTTKYPWGLSVIYQLDALPDSFVVESMMLPSLSSTISGVILSVARVNQYRSITLVFSPASPEKRFYTPYTYLQLGYIIRDKGAVDSTLINVPAAILTPYPNPAVVATMGGDNLKFRFRTPNDSTSFSAFPDTTMVVAMDIFNIAGEHVASIDNDLPSDRFDPVIVEWNMKNQAGKDVASGVYLCYVRLYAPDGKTLLAEDKMKVAIIR